MEIHILHNLIKMKPKDAQKIAIHLMKLCGDLDKLRCYESGKLNINGNLINIQINKIRTQSY